MATARKSSKNPKTRIPVRKPAAKKTAVAKALQRAPKAAVTPKAGATPRPDKPKKPKLVRDSFTIPKTEFTVLQDLKLRAGMHGTAAKKSEILRAGIKALAAMNDAAFAAALAAVPPIKTGRPARV